MSSLRRSMGNVEGESSLIVRMSTIYSNNVTTQFTLYSFIMLMNLITCIIIIIIITFISIDRNTDQSSSISPLYSCSII